MENKKLIVITGCDSGIGEELCKIYLKNGYAVAASYLGEIKSQITDHRSQIEGTLFGFKMDLRKEDEVEAFAQSVKNLLAKGYELSCFINNAGVAAFGPVENLPLQVYRETFEINYFGMVALVKNFIPFLIQSKGRIIIIGSTAGKVAVPFAAPYASSKFAVEGFSDSLRREMIPYGIKTILIEPAGIATPIWETSWKRAKEKFFPLFDKKYLKVFDTIGETVIKGSAGGLAQDKAAGEIYRIFRKKNPKARYMIAKNYAEEWIKLHIPSPLIDFALPKILGMDYGEKDKDSRK
jgi:NAD(P)-dependent dehydrogenase (short-subunit alcohol dehydrogenase family)